jgi:hypothetical protein
MEKLKILPPWGSFALVLLYMVLVGLAFFFGSQLAHAGIASGMGWKSFFVLIFVASFFNCGIFFVGILILFLVSPSTVRAIIPIVPKFNPE